MNVDAGNDLLIRRYLLATVSEDERETVETRLMVDDDFFQRINLIEDELVDEFLDGELSAADRRRFEQTFLCAPERQQKLRFARALRAYIARSARQNAAATESRQEGWRERFLALFYHPRPVLVCSQLAALLILLAGGPWMVVRIVGLSGQVRELETLQQNSTASEALWRSLAEGERARADQIAGQLRLEQERRSATAPGEGTAPGPIQVSMLRLPSFTLAAGIQRGPQPSTRLEVPEGALLVRLKLDLAENRYKTYRAVLLKDGLEVVARSRLEASENEKRITVRLDLPALDLGNGNYEIRLYGTGESEPLETFYFRIARR